MTWDIPLVPRMTHDTQTLARALDQAQRLNELEALRRQCEERGVSMVEISREADVDPSLVSHFFAGRAKSDNVERAARRLLKRKPRAGSH